MTNKVFCIAELGINANGSVELAKKLIDLAAEAGCDAIKLQKRDINLVYSQEELDSKRESPFGKTFREQKEGLEFNVEQYKLLLDYTKSKKLQFGVSCWDSNSISLIENNMEVFFHKVASPMLTNKKLLEAMRDTGKPIIVSTGMSTEEEIDKALKVIGHENIMYLLACSSTYPSKPEEMNLRYITTLKQKYPNLKIGLSNHLSGFSGVFGGVALGAECVEFHATLDRTMYGSDQSASIEDVKGLVDGIRKMEVMLGDGVKRVLESEKPIIKKLRKVNDL